MNAKVKVKKGRAGRADRKRRAAGWTLLTLGVVVACVWVASGWWAIGGRYGELSGECGAGELLVDVEEGFYHEEDQWRIFRIPGASPCLRWRASGETENGMPERISCFVLCYCEGTYNRQLSVMLWPIPLLLWAPAALLLRSGTLARRRALKGACPKCGYWLVGLGEGVPCPECGKGAAAT